MTPLFSAAYFPPVAYVAAMAAWPEASVEAKETYAKQTYRNRMDIMTAGGVRALTVPVVKRNHTRTDEVRIDYSTRWNVIHLRTLEAAYAAAPYFLYYRDDVEALLNTRYERLVDLDMATTRWLLGRLKVDCRLTLTDDYTAADSVPHDLRNRFTPKRPYPTDGFAPYYQVFADRQPFAPNLSAFDLLMNLGPDAAGYIRTVAHTVQQHTTLCRKN